MKAPRPRAKYAVLGFLFMLSGIITAMEKKQEKKIVVQALIEVTDEKGGTQDMDAIVFAKRQAEILKSKAVMLETVNNLALGRKWQMVNDQAVAKLDRMLFAIVTEGGLIQLNAVSKTDDMDLRVILGEWIDTYEKYEIDLSKKRLEREIDFLQRAYDAQEDTLNDYRAMCAKMRKQYGVMKEDDYSKLSIGKLNNLRAAEVRQAEEHKELNVIKSELRVAEKNIKKSVNFVIIHSKPFGLRGQKAFDEFDQKETLRKEEIEIELQENIVDIQGAMQRAREAEEKKSNFEKLYLKGKK